MTDVASSPLRTGLRALLTGFAAVLLAAAAPPATAPAASTVAAARAAATVVASGRTAEPVEVPAGSATRSPSGGGNETTGASSAGDRYTTGLAASSVGQLLSPRNSCSATVVGSESGRVAVTAAHCIYIPRHHDAFVVGAFDDLPVGWVERLGFQPGRTGDLAPYGTWVVERMWVDQRWQQTGDPSYDVAFLRLADQDGRTAQQTVGAQGVAFADGDAARPAVTALGYPVDAPFDGTTLRRCATPSVGAPYTGMYAMACRMTAGSSGGPWLTDFDPGRGTGTVVAVTSFLTLDEGGRLYSARLGGFARDLHHAADQRN